jgi:hypothetical protein
MEPMRVRLGPGLGRGAAPFPKVVLRAPAPVHPRIAPVSAIRTAPLHLPKVPTGRPHGELQVLLSPFTMDGEVEVVVTVRQNGVEVGKGSLTQTAPVWGASGIVSLDIKRT